VSLGCVVVGQFLAGLELFCLALCRVLLPCRFSFEGVSIPGPRGVTEAPGNVCCAAVVATDLIGSVHRSDRCHRSDRRKPSI
jgi:hypothetical protein